MIRKVFLGLTLIVSANFLSAADVFWTGENANDNWNAGGNWSTIINPPLTTDTAIFNDVEGSGGRVFANGNRVVATMRVTSQTWQFEGPDLTATNVNITGGISTFTNFFAAGDLTGSNASNITFAAGTNTLTSVNYTGTGTVTVTGTLAAPVTINDEDAKLRGTGTITGNVIMTNGIITPATITTLGTLSIGGNYEQAEAATYALQINSLGDTDLLDITGSANITNGTIELEPLAGTYVKGTRYTVLTAEGGITGEYTNLIEDHPLDFSVANVGNNVILSIDEDLSILPIPIQAVSGNSLVMESYMYGDNNFVFSNPDLIAVSQAITSLPGSQFLRALIQLSGESNAALPLAQFQNDLQMAVVLDDQYRKKVDSQRQSLRNEDSCYGIPETGAFIQPIGVFYNQRATGGNITNSGQVPFSAFTYGAGAGWEKVIEDKFIVEAGIGYTHSNLNWQQNFGNARWSTLYLAPFFGWFNENAFGNFMIMGAFNFHRTFRKIQGVNLERVARSRYTSYDLLMRGNGGARLYLLKNFIFQPEGTLNYLTTFSPSYNEYGAGSVSLFVRRRTNFIMQPSIRLRLIKEFFSKRTCHAPNLYVGWLANIILKQDDIQARFLGAPNQTFFNVAGYKKTANQLILGAQYYAQRHEKWILTANFELDMLSQFEIYTLDCKFQFLF